MPEKIIEAMLASPPDREELVVELFLRGGGQWAEIYRENCEYWIDIYRSEHEPPLRFAVSEMVSALTRSVEELRELARLRRERDGSVKRKGKGDITNIACNHPM